MTLVKMINRPNDLFAHQMLNQLFKDSENGYNNGECSRSQKNRPRVNVRENQKEFVLEIAIPGYAKEQVNMEVEKNVLLVNSDVKDEKEEDSYLRKEFDKEGFECRFRLPNTVNQDSIVASVKNGILLISLPKIIKEEPKVKKITVK